jgi:hypothetical protein
MAMAKSTIIDVAELTDDSMNTVSCVTNVKRVKPQIRKRAIRAIVKLDYRRNPFASGLAGNASLASQAGPAVDHSKHLLPYSLTFRHSTGQAPTTVRRPASAPAAPSRV